MTISRTFEIVAVAAALYLVATGCTDGRPQRVPVSGQVFVAGKPLHSGKIKFTPESGRSAFGVIDSEGRFSLYTFDPGDGCPLGTHTVSVMAFEDVNRTTRRWNAPKSYASPKSSGITKAIEGPIDSMRIDLTWGSEKGPFTEKIYGE